MIFPNYYLESISNDWMQRPLEKLQSRKDVTTKHVPEKHHDAYGSGRKTYPIRNGNKQKAAISYLDGKINELQESLPNIISKSVNMDKNAKIANWLLLPQIAILALLIGQSLFLDFIT